MAAIRVLLCGMPSLLRSMLGDMLALAPDIELVPGADAHSIGDLRTSPARWGIDVFVLRSPRPSARRGAADLRQDVALPALIALAPLGIVTIDPDGTIGTSYRLDRARVDLQTYGQFALLNAVRTAAGRGPEPH
jgi:hypothetical protein